MESLFAQPWAPAVLGGAVLVAWYFWPQLAGRFRMRTPTAEAADTYDQRLAAYATLMRCLTQAECHEALDALDAEVLPHLFHEQPFSEDKVQ